MRYENNIFVVNSILLDNRKINTSSYKYLIKNKHKNSENLIRYFFADDINYSKNMVDLETVPTTAIPFIAVYQE